MRIRSTAAVLAAMLITACAPDQSQEAPEGAAADTAVLDTMAAPATGADVQVFTETTAPGARLLFVGDDRAAVPPGHASALVVPMSTFSVERDGIPNEFPPPDSLTGLLEAAGVGGERVVIVAEPIPAGRAFAAFDYLGLAERASILDGGPAALEGDTAAGARGETGRTGAGRGDTALAAADSPSAPAPARAGGAELETDVRDDMIVDAEWVHERLNDPSVAILDARPPEEFSGETPGEGIDRPGHIPGARNVFWQTLVQSEAEPRLKDEAELRRIFEAAGAEPGDLVVAYCRTGGQGSFLYSVARHLGYDVRLYDGSFIDWSRTEYPVER